MVTQTTIQVLQGVRSAVCMCFSPHLGIGPRLGSPKGFVHNLLVQFFTPDTSKTEVFEIFFFILWSPKITIEDMQSSVHPINMWSLRYLECVLLGAEFFGQDPPPPNPPRKHTMEGHCR